MKKRNKVIKPNVVGGGVAIPLGNNFYFMNGRKHEQGGIDIGPNNKNGLEVEGGEVMQMGGKHVKVYSSLPILNGKSPAELVMAGINPDKVFNAQERFKDINKLNDDGSKKAKYGIKKKLADKIVNRVHADGFMGGTTGVSDAINQIIVNKDGDPIRRIKEIDDVNTKVKNREPLTEDEELIYKSDLFPRLNMIKQHKDALHLYLGKPQVYKTMEISPYQGIVSKDKKTYQINDFLSDKSFEDLIDDYRTWKSGSDGKYVKNLGKTAQLRDIPYMNNAGMSEGYDKDKGHYISVFDTWDYNRKVAGKHGDNVGKFIGGQPFDLYHRFYLDEWNDIPEQYRGAKWLPDMVVKPNGYHTETINIEDDINFDASGGGFKYGGKKHFTINGNIVNKAGYVPSTGELPKANLGTVASIDKHVSRKDKNGRIADALKADVQKQIDNYNASKEYREAKSAEIKERKRKELETPIEIEKPSIVEKQDNTNVVINPIKKTSNTANETERKEINKTNTEKSSTNNTNKGKISQNDNHRIYSDLAPAAESFNKTINGVKDDIKGFIDFGKNAFFRTYNKIIKPEEKESSGINYEKINNPTIEEVNDSTINDVSVENNVENIIPSYAKIPNTILGDVIPHPKNKGQYMIPENINLGSVTVGIRHRGDYSDIDTEGAITTHMNEFKPWTYIDGVDLNKGYIGVDKNGKVKVGNYYDFDENYMINRAAMNKIKGFALDDNGNILFENDKGKPASKKWSPALDRALIEYQKEDGTWGIGPSNITAYEGTNNYKTYGAMTGGRMIIKVGDETRLVSGSVRDINNAVQDMKNRHGVEFVEAYSLDNGTYNHAIRTKNKKITKDDWIEYDNRNKGGGHVLYLKRFGGMSKRQKAEVGKNIFSPRGLGIQATMSKMQADAWDKKHPGEDNPFAQQFIDNFGDPTIYSSIMSDDANARGFGIDRGYRGNTGLGFVMPELPNINLDNYFDAQGDHIVRADGGGSGVSGGKRTETKITPLGLEAIKVKPQGLTVEPVKPPTQITIKTPETETRNKGTWWRDNGSDLISGLAKGGASLASYLINRNMLRDLKYQGQPVFTPAAKLKTKININPQIDAVNRTTAAKNANVSANTASSKVRNARMNNNYIDRLGYLNELYGMKENKETELINADKLNQQEITKGNIQAYNDWVEKKQNFDNTVREKQSENSVSFVSNLASGVDDILTNRQKRKQFKQNVAAYMASHQNVSPELLESYGLDIFGNSKKTKKQVTATTKKTTPRVYTKEEQDLINTVKKVNSEYIKELESEKEFRNRERTLKLLKK